MLSTKALQSCVIHKKVRDSIYLCLHACPMLMCMSFMLYQSHGSFTSVPTGPQANSYAPQQRIFVLFHVGEDIHRVHDEAVKLATDGNKRANEDACDAYQQSRDSPLPGFNINAVVQCGMFQNGMIPVCFSEDKNCHAVEYAHIFLLRPFARGTTIVRTFKLGSTYIREKFGTPSSVYHPKIR